MPRKKPSNGVGPRRAGKANGKVSRAKTPVKYPKKKSLSVPKIKLPKATGKKRRASWCKKFLQVLEETANVTVAARLSGTWRETAYSYRNRHPDFAKEWREAEELGVSVLELEARDRALGNGCKPSDVMLIVLLKAHKPEMYRENIAHEHGGKDGGPIRIIERVVETREEALEVLAAQQKIIDSQFEGNGR